MALRTCFVISPIGPDSSDIRKRANAFLELLVEPALEKFSFDVIRADKIPSPTSITSDIIRHVQDSDICIIDLTDSNPNVFYECGRRHETGRPFVQLIDKAAEGRLPFDVAGIRTLSYDLSTAENARASVKQLQEFIRVIVDSGFPNKASGDSLASIAQGIERIERKISNILIQPSPRDSSKEDESIEEMMLPPIQAFDRAVRKGNLSKAFALAQKLSKTGNTKESWLRFYLLTSIGFHPSFELIYDDAMRLAAIETPNEDDEESLQMIMGSIKRFSDQTMDYDLAIKSMEEIFETCNRKACFTNKVKAFMANQIGMAAWTASRYELSEQYSMIAMNMNPTEPSYAYNLALIYDHTEDSESLIKTLHVLARYEGLDEDHLNILAANGIS